MWSRLISPRVRSIGISGAVAVLLMAAGPAVPQRQSMPVLLRQSGPVRDGSVEIPNLKTASTYSLAFSVRSSASFGPHSRISVDLRQGASELLHKTLHGGDPDFFAMFRVPRDGGAQLRIAVVSPLVAPATYRLRIGRWLESRPDLPVAAGSSPRNLEASGGS